MFSDMMTMFGAISKGRPPKIARDIAEVKDGYAVISTVNTYDQGPETALLSKVDAIILERYEDEAAALAGHAKWLGAVKDKVEVTDIGYGSIVGESVKKIEPYSLEEAQAEARS